MSARANCLVIALTTLASACASFGQSAGLGLFSKDSDVGHPRKAGSAEYLGERGRYVVSGGGANMWFTNGDAFHFVWRQMSGDVSLGAAIEWITPSGAEHRKACLIIRQSLEPDSAYADAVVHGNGLTALQFRESKGAMTHEIEANVSSAGRVRIEKRGGYVSMSLATEHEAWHRAGGSFPMAFREPFYVGLAVCAHDDNALQECAFTQVELTALPPPPAVFAKVTSALEFISLKDLDRHVICQTSDHIEAPNWSGDGQFLVFNSGGRLYKQPIARGQPQVIDTGLAVHCNNDHGFSPDGTQLAISDQTEEGKSLIYIVPVGGGTPTRITRQGPSYWHGWSPDGKTLAFCGQRNGDFDIYTIPANGGNETRLTTAPGLDDGPDYSPDGKYIYFNSERTGLMQIWRMKADGSDQQQVTADDTHNHWFPHPSPNGQWIVFLSFGKEVKGHPENKDVALCRMAAGGGPIQVLTKIFGGQGTINVPSWSPDSGKIAFVSYQPVYPPDPGARSIQAKP
jgi:hypothetical protein